MSNRYSLRLFQLLVVIIGIILSGVTGWQLYSLEEQTIIGEFQKDVNERATSLHRQMILNLEPLRILATLFNGGTIPDYTRFTDEAEQILKRHPDIQALEWIPRIPHEQREKYEKQLQQYFPMFEITERKQQGTMLRAEKRKEYFPVYYVAPFSRNKAAFGFDLASNPSRRKTLEEVRDTAAPRITAPITLVQEQERLKGFLAFLPIYTGSPTGNVERQNKLKGFVLGVYRIADIFHDSALSTEPLGMEMTIIDTSSAKHELLYFHKSRTGQQINKNSSYRVELPYIWGRQWTLSASPTIGYMDSRRSLLPQTISTIGIIFALLIAFYFEFLNRRTTYIEQKVFEKTNALNAANRQLKLLSHTDGLTGVANRRFMDSFLDTEWKRHARSKLPISFLFIDIDFFKLYNDNYGHPQGDKVLKKVAKRLKDIARRPGDLTARYGGEEFAIILSDTKNAESVAQKCILAVEELQIPHLYSKATTVVTISVGFCTTIPDSNTNHESLVKSADKALYRAKEGGRNRVEGVPFQT